ncbi:MAG: hypothetical protein HKN49_00310 [Gammaproteobacteria bacterium]|nr:hypothetical protein [Gammaproteobacteria bacterium]
MPGKILTMQYESLVANPETEVRRLLQHVGLAWDERCLDFHKTTRPVMTSSRGQVTEPLYASSIGRWRRFEEQLKPLRKILNRDAASP